MAKRKPFDHKLVLLLIPVRHADGHQTEATAEGNNAAWDCDCGTQLLGRCYYQFGDICHTVCPDCGNKFRVKGDANKRAIEVSAEAA
jgi:hypothetical protein